MENRVEFPDSWRGLESADMTGAMIERMTAWQCVGCGRIEDAQPCIGVCKDRKINFVYAEEYDWVLAELARISSVAAARWRGGKCALESRTA